MRFLITTNLPPSDRRMARAARALVAMVGAIDTKVIPAAYEPANFGKIQLLDHLAVLVWTDEHDLNHLETVVDDAIGEEDGLNDEGAAGEREWINVEVLTDTRIDELRPKLSSQALNALESWLSSSPPPPRYIP